MCSEILAFESMLEATRTFCRQMGRLSNPPLTGLSMQLGLWWLAMRLQQQQGVLTAEHASELVAAGMVVNVADPFIVIEEAKCVGYSHPLLVFIERLREMRDWIRDHGQYVNPPRTGSTKSLNYWCTNQRHLYKEQMLDDIRLLLLNSIGFSFEKFATPNEYAQLIDRLKQLRMFQAVYGHMHVPTSDSKEFNGLGTWLTKLRAKRKRNPDAWFVDVINEHIAHFPWHGIYHPENRPDVLNVFWWDRLDQMRAFFQDHGHTRVPMNYAQDPSLYFWWRKALGLIQSNTYSRDKLQALIPLYRANQVRVPGCESEHIELSRKVA